MGGDRLVRRFRITLLTNPSFVLLASRQCDAQASVERLYKRLHPQFIEWEDVQLTRLTVLERVEKAATTKQKFNLLSDALVISLHSVTPPDRVGVIRRYEG